MAWTEAFPEAYWGAVGVEERAERALRWPVGAVSPLWAVFGAAASAGVAWWWLTRWTQAAHVEALTEFVAVRASEQVKSAADSELRVEAAVVAADVAAAGPTPPAPAAIVEAVPEVEQGLEPDDLTRMSGIGPKLSAALAERGVTRFVQIAAWSGDDLAEVDAALKLKGRAVREAWVAQAGRLAQG